MNKKIIDPLVLETNPKVMMKRNSSRSINILLFTLQHMCSSYPFTPADNKGHITYTPTHTQPETAALPSHPSPPLFFYSNHLRPPRQHFPLRPIKSSAAARDVLPHGGDQGTRCRLMPFLLPRMEHIPPLQSTILTCPPLSAPLILAPSFLPPSHTHLHAHTQILLSTVNHLPPSTKMRCLSFHTTTTTTMAITLVAAAAAGTAPQPTTASLLRTQGTSTSTGEYNGGCFFLHVPHLLLPH